MKKVITLTVLVSILFYNCQSTIQVAAIPQEKLNRTYLDSHNNQYLVVS